VLMSPPPKPSCGYLLLEGQLTCCASGDTSAFDPEKTFLLR
jgi:hypothetical protein